MTLFAPANRKSFDRGTYVAAAIVIGGLVGAGFWPSYFSRFLTSGSEPLTGLVHVHGASLTAWIALFMVQVSLVAAGRTDLHRRLGVWGFVLLAFILIGAVPTTPVATKLGGRHMPGPALPGLALVGSVRRRRLHPAFLWGSVFLVAGQSLSAWIAGGMVDAYRREVDAKYFFQQ